MEKKILTRSVPCGSYVKARKYSYLNTIMWVSIAHFEDFLENTLTYV